MKKFNNYARDLRKWLANNPGKYPRDYHAFLLNQCFATEGNFRTESYDQERLPVEVQRTTNSRSGDSLV